MVDIEDAYNNQASDVLLGVRIMQSPEKRRPTPVLTRGEGYPDPFGRAKKDRSGIGETLPTVWNVDYVDDHDFSIVEGLQKTRRVLSTDVPPGDGWKQAAALGNAITQSMFYKFHGTKDEWLREAQAQKAAYKVLKPADEEMQEADGGQ